MPQAFTVKKYIPGNYYHIYQEGFEGRNIFLDKRDFNKFSKLLEKNLSGSHTGLELIAYSLLPNHFHLMLKLTEKTGITKLLRKVLTAYVMYFNKKYKRRGVFSKESPRGLG